MWRRPARSRSIPRWPLRTAPEIAEPSSLPAEVLSHLVRPLPQENRRMSCERRASLRQQGRFEIVRLFHPAAGSEPDVAAHNLPDRQILPGRLGIVNLEGASLPP